MHVLQAVLKEFKPPLEQLAVVALKEQRGSELVAFIAKGALLAGRARRAAQVRVRARVSVRVRVRVS